MTKVTKRFVKVQDGVHTVKVTNADISENENGEYIVLRMETTGEKDKAFNGLEIMKTLSLNASADWATIPFIKALGGYTDEQMADPKFSFDTDDFIGKTIQIDYLALEGQYPLISLAKKNHGKEGKDKI
jgi:hypothetical protein